jgi:ABC-type transport system involved in cytochrome c biogenesis ATPase subunit
MTALPPFVGLRSFGMDEEELFFGRDANVDDLVDRLSASNAIVVAGVSGCGKSSLLAAGLRPRLLAGGAGQLGSQWRF